MRLHSAFEDLHRTTLRVISGCFGRLEYVATLKNGPRNYAHWGLCRVYGDVSAVNALAETHRSLVSQVLSTPIRELVKEVDESSGGVGVAPATYVEKLRSEGTNLLPTEPAAGSARHLDSVLHALSCLLKTREQGATRRAS